MKQPLPTRVTTGLMILLMSLFPLAQTVTTAPTPRPATEPAYGRLPAAGPPSPLRFYFGDGVATAAPPPADSPLAGWAVPPPASSRILFQDGSQESKSTPPAPVKPAKAKTEPHVSWFETREGKITTGIIIAGIIAGAVVYAACQGHVVVVSDGGIRVQNKRK